MQHNVVSGRAALFISVVCLAFADVTRAQTNASADVSASALKSYTMEQLMGVDVTSVSRRPERYGDAPASIQVITQDDIRRSGATSIPEALRLADNLQVAQIDSRNWAVSARGFNGGIANKLLVMIDGRTVYTPLFSGVFWDVQNYLLDDIDRIEVISGPGGTLWGANAVNGVINIITKRAQDTQGFLLEGAGGTELRDLGGFRYGGKISSNMFYRVYGEYFNKDGTVNSMGLDREDDWLFGQGGFRLDWDQSIQNTVTFSGDFYDGRYHQLSGPDISNGGGNLLSRWTHTFSEDSSTDLQFYYDRTHRLEPGFFSDDLDTYDVDFQHRFVPFERHSIVWGAGYRFTHDRVGNTPEVSFLPPELDRNLYSFFVQDQITILTNLEFIAGTKLDHNDWTGFEVQPSGRIAWHPAPQHLIWGAVSRAVREPSRIDRQLFSFSTNTTPPTEIIGGGRDFVSESVIAYELGYRVELMQKLSISVSGFYNDYSRLRSITPTVPAIVQNDLEGNTRGIELTADYRVTDKWRLRAGYTYLDEHIRIAPGGSDVDQAMGETSDPKHQGSLTSYLDLPAHLELDLRFRYVGRLQEIDGATPSYGELDAQLAWHAKPNLQLAIVGQNLLHDHHPEFGTDAADRAEIERGCYAKLTFTY